MVTQKWEEHLFGVLKAAEECPRTCYWLLTHGKD